MSYIGQSPDTIVSRNSFDEFNFTATNTQVTFTGADNNNNTLAYNPGNVEVFLNGVRLEEADFTATNGTSVVLASGATAGDLLSIKAIIVFQVGDAVSKSSGGTFDNNVSVTGTLTATSFSGFGGNLTGVNSAVVDDTTPQLGGDLYANGKRIIFYEADYQNLEALVFANSTNNPYGTILSRHNILHDFYLANHEGSIRLVNHEADKHIFLTTDDGTGSTATYLQCDGSTGEVKLNHYGSQKLKTASTGVEVTGSVKGNQLTINAASPPADPTSGEAFIYATKSSGATGVRIHASGFTSEVLEVRMGSSSTNLMYLNNQGNVSFAGEVKASYFVDSSNSSYYLDPSSTGTASLVVAGKIGVGGQTTPLAKLDIKGDTSTFDGMSKIYLTDNNSNAASRNWSIGNGGSGYGNLTFAVSAAKDGNAGDATATNTLVITSDGTITSSGRGLTVDNSNASWHAISVAESLDDRIAFRITPSRQGQTKGISMGAIGTNTTDTGLQAYDTSDNTANDFLINPWGGNVGIGIATDPGTSLHIKDAITNPNTISSNITIPASSNSMMAGPITLNATVTVPSGSTWTIV